MKFGKLHIRAYPIVLVFQCLTETLKWVQKKKKIDSYDEITTSIVWNTILLLATSLLLGIEAIAFYK